MFHFRYSEKRPTEYIQSYIRSYWHFKRKFNKHTVQRIHPDSFHELIWVKSGTLKVDGRPTPKLFVGGFSPSTIALTGEGVVETYCVRFYAWGLVPFTKRTRKSDGLFTDAAELFSHAHYSRLCEVFRTQSGKELYTSLDEFFTEILLHQQVPQSIITKANAFLQTTKGMATVADIAEVCQLSNRQLERVIRKATGTTPQALAARIRLEYVRKALIQTPTRTVSAIAHEYGFSDQAHLNKEFKRFTGLTPVQFIQDYKATYSHLHLDM